ncbi:MBL fold metallo-hydrolase [Candidatus Bathyarchaeota archaeon]|nr:MBL fold metallo-hydrolase [Candidatus Bathyarchaeota archaeon]
MSIEVWTITQRYMMTVNCYLLRTASGFVLIDAGMAKRRGQLEAGLREAGCGPGDLKLVVLTHGHLDHVGNAAYLKERYGARVAMHAGDYGMVESGDMFVDSKGGALVGLVRFLMKALGLSDYERFTPDVYLEDGMDLSPYGLEATVVHFPGHSRGSIGVLTAWGDLFCGDLLVNNKKPERNTLIDDKAEYDASIERLRAYRVETVYPGHGAPFKMEQFMETTR